MRFDSQTLLIPIKVTQKKSSGKKPTKVKTYVAKLGDNVASIARLFGVSQESLRLWNSMKEDHLVKPGDTLLVSKPDLKPSIPQAPAKTIKKAERYIASEGDTFASIARDFGVPVVLLMEANEGFNRRLVVGDTLDIPEFVQTVQKNQTKAPDKAADKSPAKPTAKTATKSADKSSAKPADKAAGKSAAAEKNAGERIHVVKKGEGLWDISRQYGVTIEDIVRWNNLKDTKIRIGDKLKIKK